jgi:hypothetical protein
MKLYTEKEIKKFMQKNVILDKLTLSLLTPIEIPSDEEIDDASLEENNDDLSPAEEFQSGAKWMRNKIQGGNK